MIELFEQDLHGMDRQSSKGNQLKWKNKDKWYKADYLGYEGLVEYLVSHLLLRSSLTEEEVTLYETEQIRYQGNIYSGCVSQSFLREGEQLLTLERLFRNETGHSFYLSVFSVRNHFERFSYLVNQTERYTQLNGVGEYLAKLMTIDMLFLNEDRHLHNIAVIEDANGSYRFSPVFDLGAGLLSDTRLEYPQGQDVYDMVKRVKAKTISDDFEEQEEIASSTYGTTVRFSFTQKDVEELLIQEQYYPEDTKNRVRTILFEQMRKYPYLFSSG